MAKKYFGTDGIRGTANKFPITPEIALKVGMAVGAKFRDGEHRHRVVIGKDTRLSGYMVESALTAGLLAVGIDVFLVGPMPTPGVSMLTKSMRADIGIMISASHNPFHDNGIKIFDKNGNKLNDAIEMEIESMISGDMEKYLAVPDKLGKAKRIDDARGRYMWFVKNSFPKDQTLDGLKIVVDCANGAAYSMAPTILWELGAEVISIGVNPDGFNINENCGSTSPELLSKTVIENKADIGIALDGDADRLLVVDENGKTIHGDKIIGLIAEKLHNEGNLKKDTVVATQMSNLALEEYLRYFGVSLIRTNVGDRYVLEEMKKSGYNFGGEQSGHLVLSDYSSTGDGLIAALQILAIMTKQKKRASEIANIFELMPQILHNVRYQDGNPLESKEVQDAIKEAEKTLGNEGRVLVRKSGTEKLIRIMIEGKDEKLIKTLAEQIAKKI
ncbi:MAG: phosphoglucosamine mutase [Rickettsiaceae bacterium]|jgi:phosphoglucosamine mutase|nr:phosphoglucosamine mutase [Rickettsiaceae bacterium]